LKKSQFERLRDLTGHAKNLYNQTLWILLQAFEATGKYFTYPQMDKAMKQVENLEGEVNYKLLKAGYIGNKPYGVLIKTSRAFSVRVKILKRIQESTKVNQDLLGLNRNNLITWSSTTKLLKSRKHW
jgi:hypothetical protein